MPTRRPAPLSLLFLATLAMGPSALAQGDLNQFHLDASTEASTLLSADAGGDTAWAKLFGLGLGLVAGDSDSDGYALKFEWGPTESIHASLSLQEPSLRAAVKKAFEDEEEGEALRGLAPWDDFLVEFQVQLGRKNKKREEERQKFFQAASTALSSPQKLLSARARGAGGALSLPSGRTLAPAAAGTQDPFAFLEARNRLLRELTLVGEELDKPHSFSLNASYRSANDLIGQDAIQASFSYSYDPGGTSGTNISGRGGQLLEDCLTSIATGGSPATKGWDQTISLEGGYSFKGEISGQSIDSLNVAKFEELEITGSWSTKPRSSKDLPDSDLLAPLTPKDFLPLLGNTLTLSYVRPNEDFANERWIISDTVDLALGDGKTIPFTLTWSNEDEFVKGDVVRGHLGFSFGKARN